MPEKFKNKYGLSRVLAPADVFPASAWQLDNSRALRSGEMRVSLRRLHIEGTSFRQICHEAGNEEHRIKEIIKNIVNQRGKMHNPITDTGGLLYGVIDEISADYVNPKGFKPGDEVICNSTLAGTPLFIDKVTAVDEIYSQIEAEGYAIMLPGVPVVRRPPKLPVDLLLFTFNESGTIYTVSKEARGKKNFAVIGNNILLNLLFGYTIKRSAGSNADISCVFHTDAELELEGGRIQEIMDNVFSEVSYHNLLRPVECVRWYKDVEPKDMTVNCADISGAETVSVLATKSGGSLIFANFISNYNIALYVTESISRDMDIRCADGYLERYDEFDFNIVNELMPYIADVKGRRKDIHYRRDTSEKKRFLGEYDAAIAEDFIAESESMKTVMEEVFSVSKYDCNVLITGETGVGKDKIANIIQKNSSRKVQPFIKINCASISHNLMESEFFGYEKGAFTGASATGKKGYFEVADNGVIFLDEVGELPPDMQAKLLRVIQDGEFMKVGGTTPIKTNVRIISATNRNLEELVLENRFRRDLYYRLNVFPIRVPSLSERKSDIPPLIDNFIAKYNEKFGINRSIDPEATEYLKECRWAGNIRELENVVQRLIIACRGNNITLGEVMKELRGGEAGEIAVGDNFNSCGEDGMDLRQMIDNYERNIIAYACEKYGSTRKAARAIGISQTQLVRKKNKYGV